MITDIEASTAQAAQNSVAYSHAQEIHDTVRLAPRPAGRLATCL